MRLLSRKILLLTACLVMASSGSFASVITFNSLTGNGSAIPDGYAGLNWNNFYLMNVAPPPVGAATVSYAYNQGGTAASVSSTSDFNLASAWLGTEWNNHLAVEVVGLADGKVVDHTIVALIEGAPQQVNFNWTGIDQVRFSPMGAASTTGPLQFGVSELVINPVAATPEPATLLLLTPALGLVASRLRKFRVSKQ
jgi:hypothetical protein